MATDFRAGSLADPGALSATASLPHNVAGAECLRPQQVPNVPPMSSATRSISCESQRAKPRINRLKHQGTTWYNFARINSAVRMSPAMAASLETRLWDVSDIVKLIEAGEAEA